MVRWSKSCCGRTQILTCVLCRFMDQYGEMEEGALDADDIEGTLDQAGDRMQQLIR